MKIIRLIFLIIVRQIWKLGENIYHLFNEPFLTMKKLQKDRSQKYLMAATAIMPIIFYISARFVWDYYRFGGILKDVGEFFYLILGIQIVIFLYLGYWTMRVILKKHATKCA
jgi:uncharacterized protein YebE (UPF0316 family)